MIILLMVLSLMSNGVAQNDFVEYDKGYELFQKTKRPLVIVITSKACQHCGPMKAELVKVKEDYPEFILCEMDYKFVQKHFDFIDLNRGVPQTFMYAFDNERGTITRFPVLVGRTTKDNIYKKWGIPSP
jgi:thioredoxin-related protein